MLILYVIIIFFFAFFTYNYLCNYYYIFFSRDVASRNCLVNAQRVVKLGDFGMTRPMYENDYYKFNRKGNSMTFSFLQHYNFIKEHWQIFILPRHATSKMDVARITGIRYLHASIRCLVLRSNALRDCYIRQFPFSRDEQQ